MSIFDPDFLISVKTHNKKGFSHVVLVKRNLLYRKNIYMYISVPIKPFTHFLFCLLYCREIESRFP